MSPRSHTFDSRGGWPSDKEFDTAQICLQGHCINDSVTTYPRFNEDYCSRCGQPTITACRQCQAPIRGHLYQSATSGSYLVPTFCHACGAAYPWTETRLASAKEAVAGLERLSAEERQLAMKLIDAVVRPGSKAKPAATRLRKLIAKAGQEESGRVITLLVEIAGDPAKEALS